MSVTVETVLTYSRQKVQTDINGLPDANGILFLNEALIDFRAELISRGVDAAQTQESYVPSVTVPTPPNGSTFAYPPDMFFLKTIEVNFINTAQSSYVQAQQVEVSNTPGQISYDWLRANQPTSAPLIDDRGDTYEIFPAFTASMNLVNPIRIIYFLTPSPYVTTADTLNYPDTLDYYLLGNRVASLYYQSLNKFDEANYWEGQYKRRVDRLIATLDKGMQQDSPTQQLPLTGREF